GRAPRSGDRCRNASLHDRGPLDRLGPGGRLPVGDGDGLAGRPSRRRRLVSSRRDLHRQNGLRLSHARRGEPDGQGAGRASQPERHPEARHVRPGLAGGPPARGPGRPEYRADPDGRAPGRLRRGIAGGLRAARGPDGNPGKGFRGSPVGPLGRGDRRHVGQLPDRLRVSDRRDRRCAPGVRGSASAVPGFSGPHAGRSAAMIENLIALCVRNKFLTLVVVAGVFGAGLWALSRIPLDALPDLSDVQVIVYTNWEGQNPNLIEDQVTYPIVSALISAPRVKTVRGYSFFGFSYVYAIFQDGTDLYWARSRVLEYLNGLKGQLPEGVNPNLGPGATGVGWGFQSVLVDKSGKHSVAGLRTFQDWDLSYWLRAVPGVAEVSSAGGFQKQYQVEVDPTKLASYGVGLPDVLTAVQES